LTRVYDGEDAFRHAAQRRLRASPKARETKNGKHAERRKRMYHLPLARKESPRSESRMRKRQSP